jgi:hypothetical protein
MDSALGSEDLSMPILSAICSSITAFRVSRV